jgi:CRISPR/Cas system-associated endoribonuclease Cas2
MKRCRRDKNTVANISLHKNGNVVSQPQVICEIFNCTFLDNIDKLVSRKDSASVACQNGTNKITDSLYISEITEEDLLKIIQNMKKKKSTGVDGISSYVLKKCAPLDHYLRL